MTRAIWRSTTFGLAFAVGIGAARLASAAHYVEDLDVRVSDLRCGYFNAVQACYAGRALTGGPRAGVAGDTYAINVQWDQRLYVPGSKTGNLANVTVLDTTAVFGGGGPGPLLTRGELVMRDYEGPDDPLQGPFDLNGNFGHSAVGGFCCGYGVPNEGFSMTGADAAIEIVAPGENPLAYLTTGFEVALDGTPEALADFQGGAPDAPVFLPEGLIGQVTGNIAGIYGPESFYGFQWDGGLFQSRGRIVGAGPLAAFDFKLYRFGEYDSPLAFELLDQGNGFDDLLTAVLDPGTYVVGLMTSTGVDPQFTIDFLTPVGRVAVPEPVTWALMVGGFGLAGGALRRRRLASA